MSSRINVKFSKERPEFFATLNKRVNDYFKSNNIDRHGNLEMAVKTVFMFALYFGPYLLMMTGVVAAPWAMLGLCALMGIAVGGIGLSVMHDACHGSYSGKKWVNNLMSYSLNLIGGHAFNWKIQHNVLHHTYTNVHEVDEDIRPRGAIRMDPHGEYKPIHRYQHIYAWALYGLMTIFWVGLKDFVRLKAYNEEGLVKRQKSTFAKEFAILAASKAIYLGYTIALPIVLLSVAWWQVLIGFFVMHYVAGLVLALVFQPAHVVNEAEFPLPDEEGKLPNNWAVHQLYTTANFAEKNRPLTWFVGGLNYQVVHHLFPNVCHVHYPKIAHIVRQTAEEFDLPYYSEPTFRSAIANHARMLKKLGKGEGAPTRHHHNQPAEMVA